MNGFHIVAWSKRADSRPHFGGYVHLYGHMLKKRVFLEVVVWGNAF